LAHGGEFMDQEALAAYAATLSRSLRDMEVRKSCLVMARYPLVILAD
jgi:hypothetical protein